MNKRLKFAKERRKQYPEAPFIHPTVSIPMWVSLHGRNIFIDEGVQFLERGFGYAWDKEHLNWLHIPHRGSVIIGDYVEIHAGAQIDRATVKNTIIARGTKIDRNVHIAHNCIIGKNCLLVSKSLVMGSCVLGDEVYVGGGACIKNHTTIVDKSYIGAGAVVVKNITEPGWVWVGNPARKLRKRTEEDY